MAQKITVNTFVRKPKEQVWEYFTLPEHITQWNFAIPEWHCPKAENNLKTDGRFTYRMEARDGSMGFDFSGTYTEVALWKELRYALDDGRTVSVMFDEGPKGTSVTETFDAEEQNSIEMQQQGWQAILDNFKIYAENQ